MEAANSGFHKYIVLRFMPKSLCPCKVSSSPKSIRAITAPKYDKGTFLTSSNKIETMTNYLELSNLAAAPKSRDDL